jgi:glycosyltransferase involved in cell wall biosynthesis
MHQRTEQEIMQNWKGNSGAPVVSVCCTTYNHEPYIAEAIDGFLMQQTDFPFEILIRDDCSTDQTASIVKKYADKYPNLIKPVFEKENQYSKAVKPTSAIIKKAIGKYCALCEGDDYWTNPKKLQIQLDLLQENRDINLSFHLAEEVITNRLSGIVLGNSEDTDRVITDIEMFRKIGGGYCPTATMVIARKVLDPFPEFFYAAPVGDDFMQFLGAIDEGALFVAKTMSIRRRCIPGSYTSLKIIKARVSVESLIDVEENFTFRYVKSLEEMGNIISQKYCDVIRDRISERLFFLSLVYLENNMNHDYKKMVERSRNNQNYTSLMHAIMYYFRLTPFFAKKILQLRDNTLMKKIYLKLNNIINY